MTSLQASFKGKKNFSIEDISFSKDVIDFYKQKLRGIQVILPDLLDISLFLFNSGQLVSEPGLLRIRI